MAQSEHAKGRERWHLKIFKECYPKISDMEIISSENPDFILNGKSRSIGVEHRRLVKPTDNDGFDLKQEEQTQEKAVNLACEIFYKTTGKYVEVIISFVNRTKINAKNLAPEIANIVKNNIPEKGSHKLIRKYDADFNKFLPDDLDLIFISNPIKLKGNYWSFSGAGFVSKLEPELVQEAITEKNQKLPNYRREHPECIEYWLIIVIHGFRPSSWFSIPDNFDKIQFDYDFDKVFLLDVQKGRYINLKRK